ncbi:MAG: diguanylate cyclase [Desulfuromonadales bacterium]|nr:diguanylate cyclase [Desulfuromonadales bacterium]
MKLCFPVERNEGMESPVYSHFGSAPLFVVVDTETRQVSEIANRDLHHAHGNCSPLKALGNVTVDAIVVGGIGAGALAGLNRAGLTVYRAMGATVADNLAMLAQVELPVLTPAGACGGHSGGCGH